MLINKTLLMSDALNFSSTQAINPHYFDPNANPGLAQAEHNAIKAAFEEAGITVIQVPSPTTSQDGVYTANWALVRGGKALLARLPNVRKAEEEHARSILTELGKTVIDIPGEYRFSGQGDALACGEYLFCGNGYRSDIQAQEFAANELGYKRVQLRTIPQVNEVGEQIINAVSGWEDSFFYDIDLALSVLRAPTSTQPGLIAYCPEAFDTTSKEILANIATATNGSIEAITIDYEEAVHAFAANLVSTGETVVMGSHAPKLAKKLTNLGFKVITPEISELLKGGGYIRCTSLALD